jgi:phage shock protein PspC (stress-responsive transcriptional regulator)
MTNELRRSTDKRLAGVAGGLAEYFDIDATLVRVAFVVGALMGAGLIAYIVLWIVMPPAVPGMPNAPGGADLFGRGRPPTVRIAEERFARGEITAEELHRIRNDLSRGH